MVATLRSRGLHSRADWAEKDLPTLIDTKKHASLLGTLGIDADALRELEKDLTPVSRIGT
ncbi:hypothetical protein [Actinoplanes sp. NPDC048796]|uniref:hypothetical protein n=1 Tax=unclassified Actinoplanes TaxID=2626549 RepID=UPI0033F0AE3E